MGSRWRVHVSGLRKGLPRSACARDVTGILERVLGAGEGGLSRIGALCYAACPGHEHLLDGQSIDFGDRGVDPAEVPSPWRELLASVTSAKCQH